MKRDTKFNYGFMLVSLGVPLVADYFLGQKCAVIAAIIITVVGFFFLLAGHQHREKGDPPIPRSRLRRAVTWSLISAVLGGAVILIGAVVRHRPQVDTAEKPPRNETPPPTSKPLPVPSGRGKRKPPSSPSAKIEQHGDKNGAVGGNVTQGPCSNLQVGGENNSAQTNCAPPPHASLNYAAQIACENQVPFVVGETVGVHLLTGNTTDFSADSPKEGGEIVVMLLDDWPKYDFSKQDRPITGGTISAHAPMKLDAHCKSLGRYWTFVSSPLQKTEVDELNAGIKGLCLMASTTWQDKTGQYETDFAECYQYNPGPRVWNWRVLPPDSHETQLSSNAR